MARKFMLFSTCLALLSLCSSLSAQVNAWNINDTYTTPLHSHVLPVKLINHASRKGASRYEGMIDPVSVIFELSDDQWLRGADVSLNLASVTEPIEQGTFSFNLNGIDTDIPSRTLDLRQGGGLTVVRDPASGQILQIWGRKLHLYPLDHENYPGVFVNTHPSRPSVTPGNLNVDIGKHVKDGEDDAGDFASTASIRQRGLCSSGTVHTVEMAVAYDNSFCRIFSNSEALASAYVQAAVNEASFHYREDTCLQVALTHIDAHCQDANDPYSRLSQFMNGNSPRILFDFRTFWQANRRSVNRDVAYLFSGFEDGTNVIGRAFVAAVCGPSSYGWVERGDIDVLVHELGHTLSGTHTSAGIMRASLVQGDPIFFSAFSVNEMQSFIDRFGRNGRPNFQNDTRCVEPSRQQCDRTCPGSCFNGACIQRFTNGAPAGVVPCTPVNLLFRCVEQTGTSRVAVDCPSNFNLLRRNRPGRDTFCCRQPARTIRRDIVTTDIPFFFRRLFDGSVVQIIPPQFADRIQEGSTLMDTTVLPTCSRPSGSTPAPTSSPPRPSSPPPSSPSLPPNSCGARLRTGETFSCVRRALTGSVSLPRGSIRAVLVQRQGFFNVTFSVAAALRIVEFSALISTRTGLGPADVGPRQSLGRGVRRRLISVDPFRLEGPPVGASTCCGRTLFVYLNVGICVRGDLSRCVEGLLTASFQIACVNPCTRGGTVVPFSENRSCPRCRTRQ